MITLIDTITAPIYLQAPAWGQALVSVFLMDSPAVLAALVFFLLLLLSEKVAGR